MLFSLTTDIINHKHQIVTHNLYLTSPPEGSNKCYNHYYIYLTFPFLLPFFLHPHFSFDLTLNFTLSMKLSLVNQISDTVRLHTVSLTL